MARPFIGPRAKVRRARRKIQALKESFDAFVEANPYGIYAEFDVKSGDHTLHAYARSDHHDPPVTRWSILIGEIAYNLRSALDQAVCELATARGGSCDRTYFPIYPYGPRGARHKERGRSLNFSWKGAAIQPLSYRHRAIIESVQPYHRVDGDNVAHPRGNRRPFFSLWLLHEMNNADKHRALVEVDALPLESAISAPADAEWEVDFAAPVYDGAPIGWLRSPDPMQVNVDGYLATHIAFCDGQSLLRTWSVMQVLEWIVRTVENVLYDLERGEPWRTRGRHSVLPTRLVY